MENNGKKLKHPRGLYYLFGVEAWERFSYYGMRAILVLYMVSQLNFERKDALSVYAVYTGLVYLTPLIGGFLADKYLGSRKSIIIGAFVMMLGEFALIHEELLYHGLGLLIVGNGFFKPNISTLVGSLYDDNDPRRDGAFTIFYMGINLGAFFSPLVCGTLGEIYGFKYGFLSAGVGMLVGMALFLATQHKIGKAGFPPHRKDVDENSSLLPKDWAHIVIWIVSMSAFVYAAVFALPHVNRIFDAIPYNIKLIIGIVALLGSVGGLFGIAGKGGNKEDIKSVAAILIVVVFVFFFWMGFEQAGGTMTLFAKDQTDRVILGWEIPASYFQSLNPLFIVAFAPIFAAMWTRVDNTKYRIPTITKIAIGMIVLGFGFVLMYIGSNIAESTGAKVSMLFLVGVYWLHTMGELCLSPVGLSLVTKLSPARMVSLMMGVWFLSSAGANYTAGILEHLLSTYDVPIFGFLMVTSFGAGILLLVISPFIKSWMKGH